MIPRSILALPRLFLGLIFAVAVYAKFIAPAPGFVVILRGFLGQMLPHVNPLYQSFANAVVLPHVGTIAVLVMAGETFFAITMLANE